MKNFTKFSFLIIICLLLSKSVFAQVEKNDGERSPTPSNAEPNHAQGNPEAMWDLQFAYNVQDSLYGTGSLAAAVFLNSEFWVSQWNSDSLFRFNAAGQILERFTIPGLSGTRALTWDGTNLWAGNASTTIYKIDPINKTVLSQVTVPENARYLTYDSTANNNAGGFWLGNWATNIYQIDMAGNTLATIANTTHNLSGMYGAAIDNSSVGGPYLWVHWQDGASSESEIAQLSLPGGTQTGISFDITTVAGPSNGLAGGLFITNQAVAGKRTIGGLVQRTPNTVFGFELDFLPITFDASVINISSNGEYSLVPQEHISLAPDSFFCNIRNSGQEILDTVQIKMWIENNGNTVFADSIMYFSVPNLQEESFVLTGFTPSTTGTYSVFAKVSLFGATDDQPNNDELKTVFVVTDSTMARDDGNINPSAYVLNVGAQDESEISVIYDVTVLDTVTSIEIELLDPVAGLFTYGVVYELDGANLPVLELVRGDFVDFYDTVYTYTLPLSNGYELLPGRYAFAVYQPFGTNISMGQSNNIVSPLTHLYKIGTGSWSVSGVATARMIRPNFATKGFNISTEEERTLDAAIRVAPNPNDGTFRLFVNMENTTNLEVAVFNNLGQIIQTQNIDNVKNQNIDFDLSPFANGVYNIRISDGNTMVSKRIVKMD
jgi:hypothetical protein